MEINRASLADVPELTAMVGELLAEIMQAIGVTAFNFSEADTAARLQDFLREEKYFVFIARDVANKPIGFATLYESYALYAEGAFGTIPEFYVRADYRSCGVGQALLNTAKAFGQSRGWPRLELTTPPLPEFDRALAFYTREGFAITGGRKLKVLL